MGDIISLPDVPFLEFHIGKPGKSIDGVDSTSYIKYGKRKDIPIFFYARHRARQLRLCLYTKLYAVCVAILVETQCQKWLKMAVIVTKQHKLPEPGLGVSIISKRGIELGGATVLTRRFIFAQKEHVWRTIDEFNR